MDALPLRRWALKCLTVIASMSMVAFCEAASYQTVNFSVTAAQTDVAEKVGQAAEVYRRQLAVFWLGKPLPNWSRPCRISVREGTLGAGGQTKFQFVRGEVLNWNMEVQGSLERILDSVLPHEINHTIFACHFRRPLPRWADEGAATLFEHRSEQLKQVSLLNEVVRNKHELITLRDLLSMKDYPKGQRPMLTLYAQGYALADFLVQQKGRHAYLKFIADGEGNGWEQAIRANFDHEGIESLEKNWRGWVLAGMPKLTVSTREEMLAATTTESQAQETARPEILTASSAAVTKAIRKQRPPTGATIRLQSPDLAPAKRKESGGIAVDNSKSEKGASTVPSVAPEKSRRPSSIEAPVPLTRTQKSQDENVSFEKSSKPSAVVKPAANASTLSPEEEDRLFGLSAPDQFQEQHHSIGNRNSFRKDDSGSFEFSGVLLPVERSVVSGGTPQWAGFPGQKKLF